MMYECIVGGEHIWYNLEKMKSGRQRIKSQLLYGFHLL